MILYNYLLDILKYTVAGIGIIYIAFYLLKPYLDKSNTLQMLEFKKAVSQQTLPMRLQAYERLVLFIDRINPANLLIRLNGNSYTATELHSIILNEVRTEYQHNVTQQLYVSTHAWAVVKRTKDDTLNMISNAVKAMPEDATGLDLGRVILTHLSNLDEDPYDMAINLVRKDLDNIF